MKSMEADSTTFDNNSKVIIDSEICFPFATTERNLEIYREFIDYHGKGGSIEQHIIEKLQCLGLLMKNIKCTSGKPDCNVVCKTARVVDRVQFVCEQCGARQPIRTGSFFSKALCSILQALQVILAWCEDAECAAAAQYFGVREGVAGAMYARLDALAAGEQRRTRLGGVGRVVLAQLYPACLARLSPDTTAPAHPHHHNVLMLADTNHVPTQYYLHVVKDFNKKISSNTTLYNEALRLEMEAVVSQVVAPGSAVVLGAGLPPLAGTTSLARLLDRCNPDMHHFLRARVWRQALALCEAARELCAGAGAGGGAGCARRVQRYLHAALFRVRAGDALYPCLLRALAAHTPA